MSIEIRKVRTSAEIIGAVFDLLRTEFYPILRLLVFTAGPFLIAAAVLLSTYRAGFLGVIVEAYADLLNVHLLAAVFSWVMAFMSILIASNVFLVRYEEGAGILPPVSEMVAEVWKNYLPFMVLGVLLTLAIVVGLFVLIVPGIYLSVSSALAFIVRVKEGGGLMASVSRSMQLVGGAWWRTFGLIFIASLVQGFLGFIFDLPALVVNIFLTAPFSQEDVSAITRIFSVAVNILSYASLLFYSISYFALGLQYYSLREQKEAVELFSRINEIR